MPIIPDRSLIKFLEEGALKKILPEFKKINTTRQVDEFLGKFMTDGEKSIFIRRLVIISLLEKNKKYRDIKKELRVSGGTISGAKDILRGRNYKQNPNRRRKHSGSGMLPVKPFRKFKRRIRYKGTSGALDPFTIFE